MANFHELNEPVAWCALTGNGQIAHFDGRLMVMAGPVGNEHHTVPLFPFATPPTAPVPAEPVAWAATSEDGEVEALGMNQSRRFDTPLCFCTTPHTEAWRMSEAEINHLVDTHVGGPTPSYPLGPEDWIKFARAVEQATAARLGVKMGDV